MKIHIRLKTLREAFGFTLNDVESKTGIGISSLSDIENAKREPSISQLTKLSKLYNKPISYFFEEADSYAPVLLWRKKPDEQKRLQLESQFIKLCKQYRNLEKWTGASDINAFEKLFTKKFPAKYEEVKTLAYDISKQMELGAYPGESLFRILEEVYAVKIFYLHLGNDTSSASYYADELGAAIMLNSDSKQWRRNYDLAHELFHLVTWKVRNPDADASSLELEEKFADFFASNLLIPEQALHSAVVSVMSSDNKITYDDLDKIARQFNVSLDALCWRLCYVYKIPSEGIKDIIDRAKTNSNLPIRESEKPQTFPPRYIALAVNALKHGKISSKQFANYLDISISEAYSYNIQEDFDGILQIKTDPL